MLKHALFPVALATLFSVCVFELAPGYGQGYGVQRDDRADERLRSRERRDERDTRSQKRKHFRAQGNRDWDGDRNRVFMQEPCGPGTGRPCCNGGRPCPHD
jgi:hypothetical protein